MLLFISAVAADPANRARPPERRAQAMVRILEPVKASPEEWNVAKNRRERVFIDESGRTVRLRIVDLE